MEGTHYERISTETLVDEARLFSLAPSAHQRRQLMILGGTPGQLPALHLLLSYLDAAASNVRVFIPKSVAQVMPWMKADVIPEKAGLEAEALWRAFQEADVLLPAWGLRLSSQIQLIIERFLADLTIPAIFTDELLTVARINPAILQQSQVIVCMSLDRLIGLLGATSVGVKLAPERGIYNVGMLLMALPTKAPYVITYDPRRLYIAIPADNTVLHTAIPEGVNSDQVRSLMITSLSLTLWAQRGRLHYVADLSITLFMMAHGLAALAAGGDPVRAIRRALEPNR